MIRLLPLLALMAIFAGAYSMNQEQDTPADKIEIPSQGQSAVARRDFMRTKLMNSQNIFEGLTTGNYDLIKMGIREVSSITKAEQWVAIDDPRYLRLTQDFETAVLRLTTAAETGNIEATALRYYEMSTRCIDCHQHIRKVEYEY